MLPTQVIFPGLSRVDGSAQYTLTPISSSSSSLSRNATTSPITILSSCSGPIDTPPSLSSTLNPSNATLQILVRPLSHIPATSEKHISGLLHSAVLGSIRTTENPRTMIQVVVQSLTPLGGSGVASVAAKGGLGAVKEASARWRWSYVSAMINAVTLSLLDAGSVPMRGVVCAAPVALVDGQVVANPGYDAEGKGELFGCFAFMFTEENTSGQCVLSQCTGAGGDLEGFLKEGRRVGEEAASQVWRDMRASMAKKMGADVQDEDEEEEEEDDDDDAKMEI